MLEDARFCIKNYLGLKDLSEQCSAFVFIKKQILFFSGRPICDLGMGYRCLRHQPPAKVC